MWPTYRGLDGRGSSVADLQRVGWEGFQCGRPTEGRMGGVPVWPTYRGSDGRGSSVADLQRVGREGFQCRAMQDVRLPRCQIIEVLL